MVAEKDVVYKRFPIPLINRLEKHLLVMSTSLTERQTRLVNELENWVKLFSEAEYRFSLDERYRNSSLELQVVIDVLITTVKHAVRSHYPEGFSLYCQVIFCTQIARSLA